MPWLEGIAQLASAALQAFLALVAAWERAAGWVAGAAEGTIIGLALAVAAGWDEGWSPKGSTHKLALAPAPREAPAALLQALPAAEEAQPAVVAKAAVPGAALGAEVAAPTAPGRSSKLAPAAAPASTSTVPPGPLIPDRPAVTPARVAPAPALAVAAPAAGVAAVAVQPITAGDAARAPVTAARLADGTQVARKKKPGSRGPLGPLHKTMKGIRRALGIHH
ncbi:hypothetical protein ABPG75_001694 [Micractinium tetrahymenae]